MFGIASGQFIGQNIHFAINLFMALACFTAGWLYLDAWGERHKFREAAKWSGFFALAIGMLLSGAIWDNQGILASLANALKLIGYIGIIIGNVLEPIQARPKFEDFTDELPVKHTAPSPQTPTPTPKPSAPVNSPAPIASAAKAAPAPAPAPGSLSLPASTPASVPGSNSAAQKSLVAAPLPVLATASLTIALPIAAAVIAGLYLRRATLGLERHLKPLALTFGILGIAEAFGLASLWQNTDNPLLQTWVHPLGPLWWLQHLALLAAGILLMWWVWRYLTKRLITQIFLMTTSLTVTIVLVATVSITSLLLTSLQKASLASLETAAKVLRYAIDSKTAETRADAEVLAQNPTTTNAVTTRNHVALSSLAGDFLTAKQLSDVILVSNTGQVLMRASDPERYGDSLSDDSLVRRSLTGTTASSITSVAGVLAPQVIITTASPIRANGQIIGVTLASLALDNAFVDGIKHTTGLDSTVYSGAIRTATTLVGPDGTSRSIGVKETHSSITDTTLKHGQTSSGAVSVSNQDYLAIYLPLKDVDNTVVGMLFVGQPATQILQTAQQSVNLTFVLAVVWLIVIMIPIYIMSRRIAGQLK